MPEPDTTPAAANHVPVAYGDGRGTLNTYCAACPRPEGVDIPLTVNDVDHWEQCRACGRYVLDVAREQHHASADTTPAACVWPDCLSDAQKAELADEVTVAMLGEPTTPMPDQRPICGCTEAAPAPADDAHVCKPGATVYFCPTAGENESDCHGGFDVCCDRPDLHQTLVPCGGGFIKQPHGAHSWEPQPGAPLVHCVGCSVGGQETEPNNHAAHPPVHRWRVEHIDGDNGWVPASGMKTDRNEAVHLLNVGNRVRPSWADGTPVQRRLVRETTSYTVEATPPVPGDHGGEGK